MSSKYLSFMVAAMLLLGACQSTPTPEPPPTEEPEPTATAIPKGQIFRIYSSLPLSGERAAEAQGIVNAINLAIAQQTDADGTLCDGILKIAYESLDNASAQTGIWDTFIEQDNAYKARADADAMAYIGPLDSGAARVSVPILNQSSIGMVSPVTEYIGLTRVYEPSDPMVYYITGKRSFMRLGARLDILATAAANWAKTLGASKTYIVYDGEQYGLGAADTFAVAARQAGLEVSGKEMIVQKGGNLTDIISGIKSANPDLVFYAGNSDSTGGQLLRELRAAGVDASFMGTPIIQTVAFIKAAGDSAEGVYAVASGVMPDTLTSKGQTFAEDYAAKYGAAPNSAAYFGYDATTVVLNAARKVCLKNRPALIDAMIAAQNVDGAIGQWSFDSFGDIVPPSIVGYVLKAGEWQAMTTIKQP